MRNETGVDEKVSQRTEVACQVGGQIVIRDQDLARLQNGWYDIIDSQARFIVKSGVVTREDIHIVKRVM